MPEIPPQIEVQAQSVRNLRISQIKDTNILDIEVLLLGDSGPPTGGPGTPGTIPTQAAAVWTPGVNVKGYDRIQLFLDLIPGGAGPARPANIIHIDVQSGFSQSSLDDNDWYDRFTSFALLYGDSTAITASNDISLTVTNAQGPIRTQFNFNIEAIGHYMRFRVYHELPLPHGSSNDDSRIFSVKAIRDF